MERLHGLDKLMVTQKKEWGEIFTGFETKNRYMVSDGRGNELYAAGEVGGSTLARWFLKALRPFKMRIASSGQDVLSLERPFRFYFHTLAVRDGQGRTLGNIQRRFSLLRRIYSVTDRSGQEVFELFGPLLRPWTFIIRERGREVGRIAKKWSGLLKEAVSDADNFGVTFPREMDVSRKCLLMGAVFLIDFVHFENTGNN